MKNHLNSFNWLTSFRSLSAVKIDVSLISSYINVSYLLKLDK
jgi:hypothetical protein